MRSPRLLPPIALALLAVLTLAAPALADKAYDKVAEAYARAGGHLEPCTFSETELEAAVSGIPPNIRNVVPALRAAMVEGIAAHERGDCGAAAPEEGTTGGAGVGGAGSTPTTTTPTVTTPAPAQTAPAATTPTTIAPAPAPAITTETAPAAPAERDRTPLVVALIAVAALVLLALAGWGWARMRGWDPTWASRVRHAWGEAGYRTTSTWSEFTDWLRLGR